MDDINTKKDEELSEEEEHTNDDLSSGMINLADKDAGSNSDISTLSQPESSDPGYDSSYNELKTSDPANYVDYNKLDANTDHVSEISDQVKHTSGEHISDTSGYTDHSNSGAYTSELNTDADNSNVSFGFGENSHSQEMSRSFSALVGKNDFFSDKKKQILGAALLAAILLIGIGLFFSGEEDANNLYDQELVDSNVTAEEHASFAVEDGVTEEASNEDVASTEDAYPEAVNDDNNIEEGNASDEEGYAAEETDDAGSLQEDPGSEEAITNTEPYTIVRGDWLSKIAKRRLGDAMLWPKVWVLNPQIENPDLIYPGDVITVPKHNNEYVETTPYIN